MKRVVNQAKPMSNDPIDSLLEAYFKTEMPAPWPAFERPARIVKLAPPPGTATRRPAYYGKLALAASVALLFIGSWVLPTAMTPRGDTPRSIPTIGDPSASKRPQGSSGKAEKPGTLTPNPDDMKFEESFPNK